MKTYRTARELQVQIDQALLRRSNSAAVSPLDKVAAILCEGRHYAWVGIYLVAGERPGPAQAVSTSVAQSRSRTVIPIRVGQHEFGAIEVQAETGKTLTAQERILLKQVAGRLAQFLHGTGAWLVRKAREAAAEQPAAPQARGHQPASEKAPERTLAAAGEGRR